MKLNTRKLVNFVLNRFDIDLSIFDEQFIIKMTKSALDTYKIDNVKSLLSHFDVNNHDFFDFYKSLLNGYSIFFRDDLTCSILASLKLAKPIDTINNKDELRIWSVGCSNGQEPYSIAILCEELIKKYNNQFTYRIIATDISKEALNRGVEGIYSSTDVANVKYKQLEEYFDFVSDEFHIKEAIKKNVYFSEHDIVTSKNKYPPESIYGSFDIVICNNLLIYYNDKVKKDIVDKLMSSVKDNGYYISNDIEIDYVKRSCKQEVLSFKSHIIKKTITNGGPNEN